MSKNGITGAPESDGALIRPGYTMPDTQSCVDELMHWGDASGTATVTLPLPYPVAEQNGTEKDPPAGCNLTPEESTLLWHFLSGIAELRSRIDYLDSCLLYRPDIRIVRILASVREASTVAQGLLDKIPAISCHLRATVDEIIAANDFDAGRE